MPKYHIIWSTISKSLGTSFSLLEQVPFRLSQDVTIFSMDILVTNLKKFYLITLENIYLPFLTSFPTPPKGGRRHPKKSRSISSTALSGFKWRTSPFKSLIKFTLNSIFGFPGLASSPAASFSSFCWFPFCSDESSVSVWSC